MSSGAVWKVIRTWPFVASIVVPTGSDVTTGQRDRARLEAYFGALRKVAGRSLVWSPAGLWEDEEAARMAAKLGAVLAVDPLEHDVPRGPIAYARIRTLGVRSRLSTGLLMEAAEALDASGAGTAYVSVASATSFRDARSLATLRGEGATPADVRRMVGLA